MRILFLTQWFDPEPMFKGLAFARELVRRGHEVEVLTGFPNYPGGRVYPGYRIRLRQREVLDGIRITRVALFPSHDRSAVGRAANYLSFALSAATVGVASVRGADVAYVYHPPATIALPAIVLKLFRWVPYVLDIQDLWPDSLRASGMVRGRLVLAAMAAWCRAAYRMASRIAVQSPGFKRALAARGVADGKVEVVYNWCDESVIARAPRDEELARSLGMAGRFNVMFAGTMGKAQALEEVLQAAALLGPAAPEVQFVFVGGGVETESLKARAAGMALGNVLFLPRCPPSEIGPILSQADVLLVHLRDDPLYEITIPSKTQAYMALGRPILMAVKGDAAALVEASHSGVTCVPGDGKSIAAAVEALLRTGPADLRRMGNNAAAFYERELSMAVGAAKIERLLAGAAGRPCEGVVAATDEERR
ncbi:MAG: glycosyltransferase family 4 protein [Actinomycetota bacterium]|nr:glycosyltransferase family 4 protein [Actinomycetota bacterium]